MEETPHPRPDDGCVCLLFLPDLDYPLFSFSTIMSSAALDSTPSSLALYPLHKYNAFLLLGRVIPIYDLLFARSSEAGRPQGNPCPRSSCKKWKECGRQTLLACIIAREGLETGSAALSWARMTIRKVRRGLLSVRATADGRTDSLSRCSAPRANLTSELGSARAGARHEQQQHNAHARASED